MDGQSSKYYFLRNAFSLGFFAIVHSILGLKLLVISPPPTQSAPQFEMYGSRSDYSNGTLMCGLACYFNWGLTFPLESGALTNWVNMVLI